MICNFSFAHYREILGTACAAGYNFVEYEKIKHNKIACVLRHDIDYMPEKAMRFAEVENEFGITAYYFVLVNSKFYNLRESENYRIIRELAKMGHKIGLHFDLTWNPDVIWEEIPSQCRSEKEILYKITGVEPCEIISFHNPHKFKNQILNQAVKGMQHTYEKELFSEIKYLSDSQGWYDGCVCKIFNEKKYEKIQLLLHPYIWDKNPQPDFIGDMTSMVRHKTSQLVNYMVEHHPVVNKHKEQFLKNLGEKNEY